VKVCFLVNDLQLSGGIGVVVQHARHLQHQHGHDVTLALVREQEMPNWRYETLTGLHVASLEEAQAGQFDVAVATWWETAFTLFSIPADRHAFFVQSLEDRFDKPDEAERLGAALVLDLPVAAFITEARWIRDTLAQLRPDVPTYLVRNGIDKEVFATPERVRPRVEGPLRVLIEGNPGVWFKHVPEAIEAAAMMSEPHHVTVVSGERGELGKAPADRVIGPLTFHEMADVYAESHVLLKLSSVEGMSGPPLEAFHKGATAVLTPVTGHEEYVEHGFNAMVCDWDDLRGTARMLDLLARDRRLLHFLRTNALETARGWPTWEQSGQFMAVALERIKRGPGPDANAASARMLADLREGLETYRVHLQERREFERRARRFEFVTRLPVLRQAVRARQRLGQMRVLRPLRPLFRRTRAKLLGP
jgi:glycosyltransferase involved in cell wall biosynthesis